MSHDQEQAPEVEEDENSETEEAWPMDKTKPMIAGGRYKRRTMSTHFRPYVPSKKSEVPGDAEEMEAVFDARREYLAANAPQESLQEIEEDSRDLQSVLKDFPGLYDFIGEASKARKEALRRLELLNRALHTLVQTTRELEAVKGAQPQLHARVRELETQVAKENIEATGRATVEDLRRIHGFDSKQGVTKHLRRLQAEEQIANSGARCFEGEELKKIHIELSRSERTSRGKVKKNAS